MNPCAHFSSGLWRKAQALLVCIPVVSIAAGCHKQLQNVASPASSGGQFHAYAAEMEKDDGQWLRATKDYANTRYSSLNQVNTGNVANLKVAWTFNTGVARGQEAAPIVANNTMYVVSPWPNRLFALDLTKPGAPLKWSYDPNPSRAAKGEACCDWVNRGAVYADGKIIYNTLDGFTIALDANSGKLLWRTHLADISIALYGVGRSVMSYGAATLYVFGAAAQCSALGALLTFSKQLWYPAYAATTAPWGLTPLEDQQLGGVIMWVPSALVFIAIALALMARWISESDRRLRVGSLAMLQRRPEP